MKSVFWQRTIVLTACTFAMWFGVKFLLPVALPFLLGGLLAVAAEPVVCLCADRLKMPRAAASFLGITLSLLIIVGLMVVLGGILVRQLGTLTGRLPDVDSALQTAENVLLSAAEKAPAPIQSLTRTAILQTLDDSSALLGQLPGMAGSFFGKVAGSALGIGTGILAAFFISFRLPKLRTLAREKLPESWKEKYLPALKRFRESLVGWLKAQGKLALVTFSIVSLGLFVLGVRNALLWAFFVALVDAVPMLGTGIILLPWAAVSLLQGQSLRAMGLLAVYGAAALTRMTLEPRIVGRNLGLDPLLTLIAMYTGFQLWGIGGMLLTPILASAVKNAVFSGE